MCRKNKQMSVALENRDLSRTNDILFRIALRGEDVLLVKQLWKKVSFPENIIGQVFIEASRKGQLEILKFLWSLKHDFQVEIDLAADFNDIFLTAAEFGYNKILEWLWSLKQDFQVDIDPTASDNYAFRLAAKNGHIEVLKWLWSLNVRSDLKSYHEFVEKMGGYGFENIREGWVFAVDGENVVEKLMKCEVTKRVLRIMLMYLNKRKISFGIEMSKEIMKKIVSNMIVEIKK